MKPLVFPKQCQEKKIVNSWPRNVYDMKKAGAINFL